MRPACVLAALAAVLAIGAPAAAARAPRHPHRPTAASLLAAQPITPNGTLIHEGERLRTLELDELAPLRLRFTAHF